VIAIQNPKILTALATDVATIRLVIQKPVPPVPPPPIPPPIPPTPPGCEPLWSCAQWSKCINGTQSRVCYDVLCKTPEKTENKTCHEEELCLAQAEKMSLDVFGANYTLTIEKITPDNVTIRVDGKNLTLKIYETIVVDINEDGVNDINIIYARMQDNKACLVIIKLAPPEKPAPPVCPTCPIPAPPILVIYPYIIAALVILLALLLWYLLSLRKRKEILLIGCDKTGTTILNYFIEKGKKNKILVVDYNSKIIENLVKQKVSCVCGDATKLLKSINLKTIKLVISTIPSKKKNLFLIRELKKLKPTPEIVARVKILKDALELYATGADLVLYRKKEKVFRVFPEEKLKIPIRRARKVTKSLIHFDELWREKKYV
jgi:hypothetical protein